MLTTALYDTTGFYDEAVDEDGQPRPGYGAILEALDDAGPAAIAAGVAAAMRRMGATFTSDDEAEDFPVCPLPRIIEVGEWARLERALAQRSRALNAFIADIYGDREIVRMGVVGSHVIAGADHFEPAMVGIEHPGGPAPVIGFDL